MKTLRALSFTLLIALYAIPVTTRAQEATQIFSLPQGSVGKIYNASIEAVLRDYGMRLQSEVRVPMFRWTFEGGEIPAGLVLRPNGTIIGTPRVPRETPYQFKLKVSDARAPMSVGLLIEFDLVINASRIKLGPAPQLKLVSENEVVGSPTKGDWSKNHRSSSGPLPLLTSGITFESNGANVSAAVPNSQPSFTKETKTGSSEDASDYSGTKTSIASAPPANCSVLCTPTPTPDVNKDFIIDAISGTTTGRTRFNKRDRARIFVLDKNPFLYDYRILLEDKPVEEPALAAFLKLLGPVGEGTFNKPKEAGDAAKNARGQQDARIAQGEGCPGLKTPLDLEEALSNLEKKLRGDLQTLVTAFNKTNSTYASGKAALETPTIRCPQLCAEADGLQTTLSNYLTSSKNQIETFKEDVDRFREDASALKATATFVIKQGKDCAAGVAEARLLELADYYIEAGKKLQDKVNELINGGKVFSDMAENIKRVLSSKDAFNSVFEKGDFDGPTDVLIKVERKSNVKPDSEFSILKEAKLNFGGGPRFALAGGFVFSTLEKPEYQRVSAVINGATDHIVGLKENSNSRILPILMLHARLFSRPKWNYVSGIHMSLGLTAQPNNEGTDPEFLIGPSISFIEERLFFTFGGYAGRKQELEGNLTLGQKIPEGFGDELPVSKHYVWKPGFAITYKIK